MWTARILLEAMAYDETSTFFTLTYDKDHLPADASVHPEDVETFRYRLRYHIGPFRYFFVGEYGDRSNRPHYHGVVFGKLLTAEDAFDAWEKGRTHCGFLENDSAAYIAGYCCKKMTRKDDERLAGRHPEFTRQSRKPGIGAVGLASIEEWLFTREGARYIADTGDVPSTVRIDSKVLPLGPYLVQRLREAVGVPTANRTKYMRSEAKRLENATPELTLQRENRRGKTYLKAHFFYKLGQSKKLL